MGLGFVWTFVCSGCKFDLFLAVISLPFFTQKKKKLVERSFFFYLVKILVFVNFFFLKGNQLIAVLPISYRSYIFCMQKFKACRDLESKTEVPIPFCSILALLLSLFSILGRILCFIIAFDVKFLKQLNLIRICLIDCLFRVCSVLLGRFKLICIYI